jgi:hypothetical protein
VRVAALALLAMLALTFAATARSLTPLDPGATHGVFAALGLPAAWDVTTGRPDVVVAVVDTGVDASHPDLAGAVDPGYDFVDGDTDASDPPGSGHGTAVAGVVAARAGNGIDGVGVCFECHVMPLRVVGPDGVALDDDSAAAIDYAVDHGAAVVNVSLVGDRSTRRLREAIVRARAAGVLVVAAAGKGGSSAPGYPAAFPDVLSVAAAAATGDRLAAFSNRGDWVEFAAPECAPVTILGGGSDVTCATSVSAPLVAGVVALLRAHASFATAAEIEAALAATARPVPGTRFGLVDAAAALAWLGSPSPRLGPVILGSAVAGQELEAWSGLWSRSGLAVALQWQRCGSSCKAIPDATDPRYTATRADAGYALRVVASAAGVGGAASPRTDAVAAMPLAAGRPSIAGTPRVGSQLEARPGAWTGTSLVFSTRWLRCRGDACSTAAEGARYRVRSRDRGARLLLEVRAANALGRATARSLPTRVVR